MDVGQRGLSHYKLSVLHFSPPLNLQLGVHTNIISQTKSSLSFSLSLNPKNSYSPPLAYSKGPNNYLIYVFDLSMLQARNYHILLCLLTEYFLYSLPSLPFFRLGVAQFCYRSYSSVLWWNSLTLSRL